MNISHNTEIIFDIQNLSFSHDRKKRNNSTTRNFIIQNFSAQLHNNQIIAFIGSNGSGKSTLMNILSGLVRHYDGSVLFHGTELSAAKPIFLARNMSYMPQSLIDIPPLSVFDTVDLGNFAKTYSHNKTLTDKDTENALRMTGITVNPDKPFRQLSGGQQQRILIARAVCQSVNVMILDEPLSGLDIVCKDKIMKMLCNIRDSYGSLILISTHDIDLAVKYADKILYFKNTQPKLILPNEINDTMIHYIFDE